MGRIETADKLREYLDEFDILFQLTDNEAEKVMEYVISSGYTLETDGQGQLYKEDMENGECLETDIDHVVDDVCEQNYEKISDVRDYFKVCGQSERESLYKSLQGLLVDEKILNTVFRRTYFQKELQGILSPMDIMSGRWAAR